MLDSDQKKFCELQGGEIRLLAPAGCGKTHSLLWRCLHLAEKSPLEKPRFLIFTFTRAARDEIRDRFRTQKEFIEVAPLVSVNTLNSWGFRYIKTKTHNLKLISSSKDKYFCMENVLQPIWRKYERLNTVLTDSRRKNRAAQTIMTLIDTLKSLGFRHDKIENSEDLENHMEFLFYSGMKAHLNAFIRNLQELEIVSEGKLDPYEIMEHFIDFWKEATEHLYKSAFLTLDDQKYWALIELEKQIDDKQYTTGGGRSHFILVDEFQDINPLDLALLKAIAKINKAELTIIGDDDQAIYEWRGATPTFILEPEKHIGGDYKTCILGTNYRSPRNIVDFSQKLISHNKRRVHKDVKPASEKTAHVEVCSFPALNDSINYVLELVKSLLDGQECQNIALISRKRSQIIPYQIVFAGQNIPFYAAEDLQIFLSDAFNQLKDILAICARAKSGPMIGVDPVKDILSMCDKVKRYPLAKKDRDSLNRHLRADGPKTLGEAILSLQRYMGPIKGDNFGGRASLNFAMAIGSIIDSKTVSDSIRAVSDNFDGLQKDYGKSLEDIFYVDPPFLYLAEYAKRYGSNYSNFYYDIEKAMSTLARIPPEDEDNMDVSWKLPLHLMTALRAKGKEFDTVIVLDANEGIWPGKLAKTDEELEQERRLFYVAITRARKRLYFLVNETMLGEVVTPSPYIAEMGLTIPYVSGE